MDEQENKSISLKEILYILTKNWLMEVIVVVIALAAGVVIALTNKDLYIARSSVIVKANINNPNLSYSDTSLSRIYIPTVSSLMKEDIVIEKARNDLGNRHIYASSLSVSSSDDSFIINLAYTDYSPLDAYKKINAIITAAQTVTAEQGEDGYSKYFPATINIEPLNSEPEIGKRNNDLRVILISLAIGVISALALSILLYFIADNVESVSILEEITGKKNFICIPGKRKKSVADNKLKEMDLTQLSDTLIYIGGEDNGGIVYQTQSSTHSEGKSTITANLAISLGQAQRKTLVIDCDFNKMKIHRLFNLDRHIGITDYFKDEKTFEEIVKHTEYNNVDIITCGEIIDNHTIIFASKKFEKLIGEAKSKYDFILLDCAPVGIMSDYINVSKHVDKTLIVVGCNQIKSITLKNTVKELDACGANVVGTAFNFCNSKANKYYHYYSEEKYCSEK